MSSFDRFSSFDLVVMGSFDFIISFAISSFDRFSSFDFFTSFDLSMSSFDLFSVSFF